MLLSLALCDGNRLAVRVMELGASCAACHLVVLKRRDPVSAPASAEALEASHDDTERGSVDAVGHGRRGADDLDGSVAEGLFDQVALLRRQAAVVEGDPVLGAGCEALALPGGSRSRVEQPEGKLLLAALPDSSRNVLGCLFRALLGVNEDNRLLSEPDGLEGKVDCGGIRS